MRISPLVKFGFVFLILYMVITINLPDGMLVRVGLDPSYLYATLTAIILAGMVAHKHLAMAVLVILVTIGTNLPAEMAETYNINRDYLLATLIAIVIIPTVAKWFD